MRVITKNSGEVTGEEEEDKIAHHDFLPSHQTKMEEREMVERDEEKEEEMRREGGRLTHW